MYLNVNFHIQHNKKCITSYAKNILISKLNEKILNVVYEKTKLTGIATKIK